MSDVPGNLSSALVKKLVSSSWYADLLFASMPPKCKETHDGPCPTRSRLPTTLVHQRNAEYQQLLATPRCAYCAIRAESE